MLSYQHAYHAGNFADLQKHAILMSVLNGMTGQPTTIHYFDSHAGDGRYDLNAAAAQKTREARSGFLAPQGVVKNSVVDDLIKHQQKINPPGHYAGSPLLAASLLRSGDLLTLTERHPAALTALRAACKGDARIEISDQNGFEYVANYALPPDREAIILIDPSYETRPDYKSVLYLAGTIIRRWRRARVLVWFPMLADGRHESLIDGLQNTKLARGGISILMRPPECADNIRMIGSGMAMLGRQPWQEGAGLTRDIALFFKAEHQYIPIEPQRRTTI